MNVPVNMGTYCPSTHARIKSFITFHLYTSIELFINTRNVNMQELFLKLSTLFESIHVCEHASSLIKIVKSKACSHLTDTLFTPYY